MKLKLMLIAVPMAVLCETECTTLGLEAEQPSAYQAKVTQQKALPKRQGAEETFESKIRKNLYNTILDDMLNTCFLVIGRNKLFLACGQEALLTPNSTKLVPATVHILKLNAYREEAWKKIVQLLETMKGNNITITVDEALMISFAFEMVIASRDFKSRTHWLTFKYETPKGPEPDSMQIDIPQYLYAHYRPQVLQDALNLASAKKGVSIEDGRRVCLGEIPQKDIEWIKVILKKLSFPCKIDALPQPTSDA